MTEIHARDRRRRRGLQEASAQRAAAASTPRSSSVAIELRHVTALLPIALANAPTPKDVVIATMGASAALGGLVLVFLGLVITAYQALPRDTPKVVRDKRRKPVWPVLGLFVLCVTSIALGFWWLEADGNSALYAANNAFFAAELAGIVLVAGCTAKQMLG